MSKGPHGQGTEQYEALKYCQNTSLLMDNKISECGAAEGIDVLGALQGCLGRGSSATCFWKMITSLAVLLLVWRG